MKKVLLIIIVVLAGVIGICYLLFTVKVRALDWSGIRARREVPLFHKGKVKFNQLWFEPVKDTIKFSIKMPDGRILTYDQLTYEAVKPYVRQSSLETYKTHHYGGIEYDNGFATVYFDKGELTRIDVFVWLRRPVRPGQSVPAIGNQDGSKIFPLPVTKDELIELFGKPTREHTYLFST